MEKVILNSKRKVVYAFIPGNNYTVVLTYIGMLFSFAGIHFVFSNSDRSFILALLCLMIAEMERQSKTTESGHSHWKKI